jgi:hypothetical protein
MAITDHVQIPSALNPGVSSAKRRTMLSLLGNPRGSYSQECRPVTNPVLRDLMVLDSVGPFRVTGLLPAVESLKAVMADVEQQESEVYHGLGSAGMLCVRLIRGSTTGISNHSWGTAVDLKLNGILDVRGDDRVMIGLAKIAPIFNRHGWYWGAEFRTEDAMHFEVSDERIREWHAAGMFGAAPPEQPPPVIGVGDRGSDVVRLQTLLNELGAGLVVDGQFGPMTEAAVMSFQAENGLEVDGLVGRVTWAALGV